MEYTLTKIDAAVDQLDWAIRLFLDHQAYVPAITLAGAAEEIIGETLQDRSIFKQLKTQLAAEYKLPEKVLSQAYLNKTKNWLKHWLGLRDEETISVNLEVETVHYLVRALANLDSHDQSLPSEGPRFFKWLSGNHKRLTSITF